MLELIYDFVVNFPGITGLIVFLVFMYTFRPNRTPYGHGD